MLYGAYVSAAGALANSYRQDVIANNLANVETVAFKRDLALLQTRATAGTAGGQRKSTAAVLEGIGGGIFALPTWTDFSPAGLRMTGSHYDFALDGQGFFRVQNGSAINYTRDGRFTLDDRDRLVTRNGGLAVLDDRGVWISLTRGVEFRINDAGWIEQGGERLTRLSVVDFEDTSKLRKQGESLYVSLDGDGWREAATPVKQGFVEMSGVNTMSSMVEMIKAQRMFQTNVRMMQLQDTMLGAALAKLGSIT